MADTFPLLMTSLVFQLDKGISYLAPMFLDYVICSGLSPDLMEQLESCLPHTTTRQAGSLSLVQLQPDCALIGGDHNVALPCLFGK